MTTRTNDELSREDLLDEVLRERFELSPALSAYYQPPIDPGETDLVKARRRRILNESLPSEIYEWRAS